MGALNDQLGNRAPGELVRSADWNALVEATDALMTEVREGFEAVAQRIDAAEERLEAVAEEQAALRDVVQRLSARHLDVALSTTRPRYAVGERAEILVSVTDLDGQPPGTPRPWVDFVTVWGRLSPVGGPSRVGAEGRTVSMQVDAEGQARVRLSAGAIDGVTAEVEAGFEVALGTRVPASQLTLAQAVLAANTPAEAQTAGHFALATQSYLQASQPAVQTFADHYFVQNPALVAKPPPLVTTGWRDYRSTVLAFAKPDPDPETPDAALGASALQVEFRDWLAPWIVLDVLQPGGVLTGTLANQLNGAVGPTFAGSVGQVTDVVAGFARDRGLLGRLRLYKEVEIAVGELAPADPVPFLGDLKDTVTKALRVQEVLEPAQSAVFAGTADVSGMAALTGTTALATGGLDSVEATVTALGQSVEALDQSTKEVANGLQGVRENVRNLDGKVGVAVDKELRGLSDRVTTLDGRVGEVSRLYPEPVRETIVDFHSKLVKVDQLEQALQELQERR